jgi:ParB-like chromosome segregation protein Spo0J
MELETVAIGSLNLDPQNARKHSSRNLEAIKASLEKFGQRKPIVVHNGVVIAGNGTLEAAKSLGWKEIAVSVCPADWDSETAKAYALADNRSAELAEWDEGILSTQLLDLENIGWNIETLGFEKISAASVDDWADAFEKTAKEQSPFQQVTFTLSHEQVEIVGNAISASIALGEFPDEENTNKNGNALARMAEIFLGMQV